MVCVCLFRCGLGVELLQSELPEMKTSITSMMYSPVYSIMKSTKVQTLDTNI